MENTDKVYLWLVIITFLALGIGIGLQIVEWNEFKEQITDLKSNPFESTVR